MLFLDIVGIEPEDLSTVDMWFDRIVMPVWRVLLQHLAQLTPYSLTSLLTHVLWAVTGEQTLLLPTNYRAQTVEATKLVDTETQATLDEHCTTTRKGSDADVYAQLARRYPGELRTLVSVKGYDRQPCETLRDIGICHS